MQENRAPMLSQPFPTSVLLLTILLLLFTFLVKEEGTNAVMHNELGWVLHRMFSGNDGITAEKVSLQKRVDQLLLLDRHDGGDPLPPPLRLRSLDAWDEQEDADEQSQVLGVVVVRGRFASHDPYGAKWWKSRLAGTDAFVWFALEAINAIAFIVYFI